MTIQKGFKKRSRKKSLAGKAFSQHVEDDADENKDEKESSSSGKSGKSGGFSLRRHLARKVDESKGELMLQAEAGDLDAIQLLTDSGFDAKESLSLSSLASRALGGDYDAFRILRDKKGIDLEKGPEEIDDSPLKRALLAASQRIQRMSQALQQEKQSRDKPSFLPTTR